MFVLLLHFVVANEHLGKDTGRVGAWFTLIEEPDFVFLRFLPLQIHQEAEFVEGLVLIEVVKLAGNLLTP